MTRQIDKVMTPSVMDQWHAGSPCISPYSYLARKNLGMQHVEIEIPDNPPPVTYNSIVPDYWMLTPDQFKAKHRGEFLCKVQRWYIAELDRLQNCSRMFEIDYMPMMKGQPPNSFAVYEELYREER